MKRLRTENIEPISFVEMLAFKKILLRSNEKKREGDVYCPKKEKKLFHTFVSMNSQPHITYAYIPESHPPLDPHVTIAKLELFYPVNGKARAISLTGCNCYLLAILNVAPRR